MIKYITLVVIVLTLPGCVKVEMPEHLVADSVAAGKSLYSSITGKSKEPTAEKPVVTAQESMSIEVSNIYVGSPDEPDDNLQKKCLIGLKSGVMNKLAISTLEYRLISEKIVKSATESIITCKVAIL